MANEKGYKIEVSTSYAEFWRYNVALVCGCFDAADQRTAFVASDDTIAQVGSNLPAAPKDYPAQRIARIETPEADHIVLYIYIIPNTLPIARDVIDSKPFTLQLHVNLAGSEVLKTTYPINQWSGASIELRIPQK
ncbi:MAG: hypothetical protein RRZ83_05430 [Alistipes sp.]